jgi:hypothetical protein
MSEVAKTAQGRPVKTVTFSGLEVKIDRPKGFVQTGKDEKGETWERKYKYDYGYLARTKGGDGDGVDVFIGPDRKSKWAFWAVQKKHDGSFDEYKVFLGFPNRDAAIGAYKQHIPAKLLKSMLTVKLDMMKALMNIEPEEKVAMRLGFADEFAKISHRIPPSLRALVAKRTTRDVAKKEMEER